MSLALHMQLRVIYEEVDLLIEELLKPFHLDFVGLDTAEHLQIDQVDALSEGMGPTAELHLLHRFHGEIGHYVFGSGLVGALCRFGEHAEGLPQLIV